MNVSGLEVLITGGSGGLGGYIATRLAEMGARDASLDITQKENQHSNISQYLCDVSDASEVIRIFKEISNDFFSVSVYINCAGIMHSEPILKACEEGFVMHSIGCWNSVLATNLSGTFFICLNAAEQMIKKRIPGLIINFSSISAHGNIGQAAYSASKAGVEGLTKSLAKELSIYGVRAAAIAPGFIDTEATHCAINESNLKSVIKKTPSRRLGKPEEIMQAVKMIIENDFFNGKILEIDGGLVF